MCMADMDALGALAEKHGLVVIEDCAHAHGAKWRERGAGSLGRAGAFSLQTTKLLTAGEGGVVTTNDDETVERAESYINCGRASRSDRFGHRLLGFNYRLTEFQAAVLVGQLEKLPGPDRSAGGAGRSAWARLSHGNRGAVPRRAGPPPDDAGDLPLRLPVRRHGLWRGVPRPLRGCARDRGGPLRRALLRARLPQQHVHRRPGASSAPSMGACPGPRRGAR